MFYFLILTALTVSIDSLVCGFSLSLFSKKKFTIILSIALTVFIMCAFVNYLTAFFSDKFTSKTTCFGGLILVFIGFYNLFKKEKETPKKQPILKISLLSGFAVGLDGALANLSLSLMGINAFYVPLTIALCHALMVGIGISLSQNKIVKTFAKIEFLAPVILIALGCYKLLGLFI